MNKTIPILVIKKNTSLINPSIKNVEYSCHYSLIMYEIYGLRKSIDLQ